MIFFITHCHLHILIVIFYYLCLLLLANVYLLIVFINYFSIFNIILYLKWHVIDNSCNITRNMISFMLFLIIFYNQSYILIIFYWLNFIMLTFFIYVILFFLWLIFFLYLLSWLIHFILLSWSPNLLNLIPLLSFYFIFSKFFSLIFTDILFLSIIMF